MGDADPDNDGETRVSDAAAVQGLIVNDQNISSLAGIEALPGDGIWSATLIFFKKSIAQLN